MQYLKKLQEINIKVNVKEVLDREEQERNRKIVRKFLSRLLEKENELLNKNINSESRYKELKDAEDFKLHMDIAVFKRLK